MSNKANLPEGWEWVKLGEVCEPKITMLSSTATGLIDHIDISAIDNQYKKLTTVHTIEAGNAPSRAKQILQQNDILVSVVRPNLNAVAINDIQSQNPIVASTGYCVLRCKDTINYKYLFAFCRTKYFVDKLTEAAKGSSYPAVTNDDVFCREIPLPPLAEQRRITAIIDAQLAAVDKAKKAAMEQSEAINAMPAAILRKAFAGEM